MFTDTRHARKICIFLAVKFLVFGLNDRAGTHFLISHTAESGMRSALPTILVTCLLCVSEIGDAMGTG